VQFVPTYHLVYGDSNAVATIGKSCDSIGWIRRSAWYSPHTLNIYYVKNITIPPEMASPGLQDTPGLNCDHFGDGDIKGDANITFIGGSANLASLAHEIGHAFGLRPGNQGGHTNSLKGFGPDNVMWGGGSPTRSHFSLGQAFRMNTQSDEWGGTMLIANGLRPGPGRACPPLRTSDICPPLALDWVQNASVADGARRPQEPEPAARAPANWFECEHCDHDELTAVTHYGQTVVPDLIAVLNQGPSRPIRENVNRALEERYGQLVAQSKRNLHVPMGVDKEKFVELYLGILDMQYRVRAAQALAAIGGDRARAALEEEAASEANRDEVRATARESLRKLAR
jgi:hypothetical protein